MTKSKSVFIIIIIIEHKIWIWFMKVKVQQATAASSQQANETFGTENLRQRGKIKILRRRYFHAVIDR